ncbi:PAS domain-containing protein [Denitromonas iodatirespirans]|uniref:histidine kinase n=1 Tax=Denitromonas iodatirespirans TaxID=2795389 RepID=A0A944H8K1_DENI1|nr:PAS domain-containing protein [Denitromonas iodatirespirans]MBT0961465.1 PAS domain-containing protein [Denitromonas iodatirespirans]
MNEQHPHTMNGPALSELCSGDIPVTTPRARLSELTAPLSTHRFVVVVDKQRPVGLLSAALLLDPPPTPDEKVRSRMAPAPLIDACTDCRTALQHLQRSPLRALVLVDDSGGLVGLVGEQELLQHFAAPPTVGDGTAPLESADISLGKALDAVRHSERILDSVFSALPDLFFHLRRDGTIIDFRARDDDLHAPPDYFLGKRMQDVLPDAPARRFSQALARAADSGAVETFDYTLEVNGGPRRYEARLCPLDDSPQLIAVVRDITDSHATAQALRESETRLAFALDAAEGGVWDWDLASDTWQASAHYFRQLDYPVVTGPLAPADALTPVHPDDRALVARHMDAQRKLGAPPFDIEIRLRHADGQDRWIRRKGKTVAWDAAGRPLRVVGTHTDITERKAEELAQQALNRKLEKAQSLAHVGWWEWSPTSGRLQMSDELLRIHGLPPGAQPPSLDAWLAHVVAEDRPRVQQALETALASGQAECEFAIHRDDTGERRDLKAKGYVSFDAHRQPVGLFGVTADVTELRDMGRRYALAARIGEAAAWEIWPNEGRLVVDANLALLTGDPPDALPGTLSTWLSRLPDDDAAAFLAALERIAKGDTHTLKLDHRVLRRDGRTAWLHVQGQRVSGPGETPLRILGSSVDITEQKHAESLLRDSEARFRALTTVAPVGIYHADAAGELLYANARWSALSGLSPDEGRGHGWARALHPKDRQRIEAAWQAQIAEGRPFNAEYRYRRATDDVWVFSAAEALHDDHGQISGYLGITLDISEHKRADAARQEHIRFLESLEHIDAALRSSADLDTLLAAGTEAVRHIFDCDRAWLMTPCDPAADSWRLPVESTRLEHPGIGGSEQAQPMTPDIAGICRKTLDSSEPYTLVDGQDDDALAPQKAAYGVRSLMLTPLQPSLGPAWALGIHQCSHARQWSATERHLFAETARRMTDAINLHTTVQQLRASQTQYRSVVEDLPVLVCRHRADGIIEFVNEAYCRYFGQPREALVGHSLFDHLPPAQRATVGAGLAALNAAHPVMSHTHEVIDAHGQIRWQRWTRRAICDAQGQVVTLQAFGEDITERKRTEEALIRKQSELAEAQEQARLGSFVWNISSGEIRWSDQLFRLFGLDPLAQPPTYHLFLDAVHADDTARVDAAFKNALKHAIPFREEFRLKRPDGEHCWLFAQGRIETELDGRATVMRGTLLDITERVLTTEALQHAHDELEQRVEQRTAELQAANAELEAFTYAASHDLRAPLRAIQGFQRAIEEDFAEQIPEGAHDFLQEIATASARMGDLIDGLLELSRSSRATLVRQPIDLGEMAHAAHRRLSQLHPDRDVRLQCEGALDARGDSRLLATVMQNLIENAWKYSRHRKSALIRVSGQMQNGQQVYAVADNGAGFDPAFAGKLFEPFQRLHHPSEFPGIGIGLATVARIIRRHGGWIEGEGRPGQGACFRFSLGAQEGEKA